MKGPAVSVPTKRTSGWVAETDPDCARAWLEALPLANSGEAAREIYQALYTINRSSLPVDQRLELMALYQKPVATISSALQSHLLRATQPLSPKKRQLAEFVRRLQMESAYGYKCCLQDLSAARFRWGRDALLARTAERALFYLREVLVRSYLVYMPYPAGVWSEIHEIYRFVEARQLQAEAIELVTDGIPKIVTPAERYMQTLLLGVSQPYQLPQHACTLLCAFLEQWGGKAHVSTDVTVTNPAGHFVIDLSADAPPLPAPRNQIVHASSSARVLNTMELVHVANGFIGRLQKGEPVATFALGIDCLEETCLDLLQRMVSLWGLTPRRRFKRIRRNSYVSVCSGIPAVRFFANDQIAFVCSDETDSRTVQTDTLPPEGRALNDAVIELDPDKAARTRRAPTSFRVDRWHVRDVGPQGMLLARYGEIGMSVRVGDLLGLQEVGGARWSVAVVRWLKSPESQSLELGIELLAADSAPVAVRKAAKGSAYAEALLLPPTTAPRRPATLLLARGVVTEGRNLYLLEARRAPRLIRPLKLIERTTAYERILFADVATAPS